MGTKKTSSKEVKAEKAKRKAPPAPERLPGCYGKIQGCDGDEPTLVGSTVKVSTVIDALERGWTDPQICTELGIVREDVEACRRWMTRADDAELDAIGATLGMERKDPEPPNPDPVADPAAMAAEAATPLRVRKVELSKVVPGSPIVLERMHRTLTVSLTEGELATKRQEVFVASRTLRDADSKLAMGKAEIKRVREHERALHEIIDRGQEERSVLCERVLDGTLVKLYRVDLLEVIDTRTALSHERQLTLTE